MAWENSLGNGSWLVCNHSHPKGECLVEIFVSQTAPGLKLWVSCIRRLFAPSCRLLANAVGLVANAVGLVAYFTQSVHYAQCCATAVSCSYLGYVPPQCSHRVVLSGAIFGLEITSEAIPGHLILKFWGAYPQIPLAAACLYKHSSTVSGAWVNCSTHKF